MARKNLYSTHPNLYLAIMCFATWNITVALALLVGRQYMPFHMSKFVPIGFYLTIGLSKLISLNIFRNLRLTKMLMIFSMSFSVFLGFGSAIGG